MVKKRILTQGLSALQLLGSGVIRRKEFEFVTFEVGFVGCFVANDESTKTVTAGIEIHVVQSFVRI